MSIYTTIIQAISPTTGELTLYAGQNVPGISFADAQNFCERNGLGYCKVDGLLEAEIDEDGSRTDFGINYN
ncbi:MAG: hypothetical protein WC380_00060 [Pedobacter sp.]|jgi:hypothetical protein